nr:hypothetical protein BaRGS_016487 [Batillaria attramentaria]
MCVTLDAILKVVPPEIGALDYLAPPAGQVRRKGDTKGGKNRAWRVVLDAGFLRVCPIQPHFLCRICLATGSCPARSHSSSFRIFLWPSDVEDAPQTGKAVFCEKPITSEYASTAACYDLAESQKKPLFNAFHR